MDIVILAAGIFVFLAYLLDSIFKRVRIPDILLWMLIGVVAANFIKPEDFGEVGKFMGTMTLVVILFESGLSLPISELLTAAKKAVPFAMITFFVTVAGLAVATYFLLGDSLGDQKILVSILTGFILGGTSSAVVIPLVTGLNATADSTAVLTLESALTDVLCIVGTIGIITGMAGVGGIQAERLVFSAILSLGLAMFLGVCSGLVWSLILDWVRQIENSMYATLAYALIVYGLAQYLGISGAIAAMALGITIGNMRSGEFSFRGQMTGERVFSMKVHQLRNMERKLFKESVFLLKAFFFFYLGLTVEPGAFWSHEGLAALVLALVPLAPRLPIVRFMLPQTTSKREATLFWFLVPRGLAAAVLAQLPVQMGIEGPWVETVATVCAMMVFLSISLIAILVFFAELGIFKPITNLIFAPFAEGVEEAPPEEEALPGVEEDSPTPEEEARDSRNEEAEALLVTPPDRDSGEVEAVEAQEESLGSESQNQGATQTAVEATSDTPEKVDSVERISTAADAAKVVDLQGDKAKPYRQSESSSVATPALLDEVHDPLASDDWEEPPG